MLNHYADIRRSGSLIQGPTMRLAAILLTGILIGCVADPELEPGSQEPQRPETQALQPPAVQPAPKPDETAAGASKPAETPPETPTKTVSVPPVQLLGMSREDIVKHLGQPVFQRRDRTVLLLRYRQGRCVLDVYLYSGNQGGDGKRVDYFEARADDGQLIETKPCIEAVRKANSAS